MPKGGLGVESETRRTIWQERVHDILDVEVGTKLQVDFHLEVSLTVERRKGGWRMCLLDADWRRR